MNGRVLCAGMSDNTRKRLGGIAPLAVEAAKTWVFQPVLSNTKPVVCIGRLDLEVAKDGKTVGLSAH
jgi:hypothetical protein